MKKCKVCGKRLKMDSEKRYEVVKIPHSLNTLFEAPIVFECFDCPRCGCQNAVNVREGNVPNPEDMKG